MKPIRTSIARIAPTLGPLGRWLRRVLHLDRRWGVRYAGGMERFGFMNAAEAETWLHERELIGIVYYADPIDLRFPVAPLASGRSAYRP